MNQKINIKILEKNYLQHDGFEPVPHNVDYDNLTAVSYPQWCSVKCKNN